jgi:hypothetical protein
VVANLFMPPEMFRLRKEDVVRCPPPSSFAHVLIFEIVSCE